MERRTALLGQRSRVQNGYVRQIPVPLPVVEAVADHELVRDLKARVAHRDVDLPPLRLGHQGTNLQGGGRAGLERADEIGERQAGIDDVLDDEDVPSLDVDVEIL